MVVTDPASDLRIADPDEPLLAPPLPTGEELREARSSMILSASGWRKVFSADGDEESFSPRVSPADIVLAAQAALAYSDSLKEREDDDPPVVAVGCDTRPTGPALADAATRMLLASGCEVHPLFITAAPEIMAYVKTNPRVNGFIYVSASHNPVGHNGIKFGYADGAVAGGDLSRRLIAAFRQRMEKADAAQEVNDLAARVAADAYTELLQAVPRYKGEALARYTDFTRLVAAGGGGEKQTEAFLSRLAAQARAVPTGIIAELNGSARSLSIDRRIFENLGFLVRTENDQPGRIVHRIVPEGESLEPCARLIEKARKENPAFTLGYVPDNDGDRGNLVYFDTARDEALAVPAQQLFALTVLAELSFLSAAGTGGKPVAVVVNGPTSMRIEAIARRFGAAVFRTEVGEANVVTRARELREEGYVVRILGEGSNGGNITHPSTVRDPLNTLFSILKLLLFRGDQLKDTTSHNIGDTAADSAAENTATPALFRLWCNALGEPQRCRPGFTLTDIIESIPPYRTTSAFEAEAKMHVRTQNHARLKARYEEVFLREWERSAPRLREEYGIVSWREVNYEGTRETTGFGSSSRSGDERGGLKIIFSDAAGRDTDFIWMRGSGTEPVFRILADSSGNDPQRERELLGWQRRMIEEADTGS